MNATRRFTADAGHELRTPLTGMQANLDALDRNPDLPADQRAELVRETLDEQRRIVALLDGLQALARGEAAESLPREDVELADLVDTAVFQARRRHHDVSFELVDDIGDAVVHGWPGGLRLIVDNLLDNAARHGGQTVRVGLEERGGELRVRVDDDGPGIPEEERDRLLEPFARGAAAAVATDGTGLGLAIVAQQVALHGGTLTLGDSPLGGLGVVVQLPGGPLSAPGGRS
jgi:signal transduction histidine kinase